MSTDLSFFRQLAAALSQGPVVLAIVVRTTGSVPREVGAKLWVSASGQMGGTIGGGAGEAKVLKAIEVIMATGQKQPVAIDLTGAPQRDIQGVCGGQMQVWLERWQGEAALTLARQIVVTLTQGRALNLVMTLDPQRLTIVSPGPDQTSPSLDLTTEFSTFALPLQPPPTLLIVGAGHCGIQLAAVAHKVGFQVVVQDDRPAWANAENFPQASHIYNHPVSQVIDALADRSELYAALVTRGFDYDVPALQALLKRPHSCRYIGMIGSQKRIRKALSTIQLEAIAPASLETLYAPIGLDIGALTPEEIAVSIVAELILVRRGGTGRPLSVERNR